MDNRINSDSQYDFQPNTFTNSPSTRWLTYLAPLYFVTGGE